MALRDISFGALPSRTVAIQSLRTYAEFSVKKPFVRAKFRTTDVPSGSHERRSRDTRGGMSSVG